MNAQPTPETEAPVTIHITVWMDREPDIDTGGLPTYLACAALWRALEVLDPEPKVEDVEEQEG